MRRGVRPIVPAPATRTRYPRAGFVWGAFAAGSLAGVAHADCALPDRGAASAKADSTAERGEGNVPLKKVTQKGVVTKGADKPIKLEQPVLRHTTGGVAPRVSPPEPRPPVPGAPPVVVPSARPGNAEPPRDDPPKPPSASGSSTKPRDEEGDGRRSALPPVLHPHGPDEPCHHGGRQVVVRYT
jgi:hypothetical protein